MKGSSTRRIRPIDSTQVVVPELGGDQLPPTQELRRTSTHLNPQQTHDWHQAILAVQETAANTDHESGSKTHLDTMAQYVRDEPETVVRLLTLI